MNKSFFKLFIVLLGTLFIVRCAMDHIAGGGGGSDVGNGVVVGKIVTGNGKSPVNARVLFIPSDYDPQTGDFGSDVVIDSVDSNGNYQFIAPQPVTYNLQAMWGSDGSRLLIEGIRPTKDSVTTVHTDTLRKPGTLKVMAPDSADRTNGYLYVPGTTISASLLNHTGLIELDSIPTGTLPVIYYSAKNNAVPRPIRYNITVNSGITTFIYYSSWTRSRRIFLNTSVSGAGAVGNVFNFPVLVRLTKNNFNFPEAKPAGDDIRFAKQDNTALSFEIERWDPMAGLAELWVKIDTVFGNDSGHCIMMYWGNQQAAPISNGAAVFDTGNGFQGVWHMNQAANSPVRDATYNNYIGTRFGQNAAVSGAIGTAQAFDGSSTYLQMMGTAYGKMNFPKNGYYCVSAWVYTDTLDMNYHIIASKGNTQYNLEIRKNNNWQFNEYKDLTGWEITNSPGTAKTWTYLAGVRSGTNQYLYVNGICTSNTPWIETNVFARYTGEDFKIGRRTDLVDYFFNGMIDEVRVSSIDLSADWIKLCYMNQRLDDKLVTFK
jgi:hypothetical protein